MGRIPFFFACACGAGVILVAAVNVFIDIGTRAYIYKSVAAAPDTQTALIPGAAVLQSGMLSPIFQDRVDMAIQLYEANKVSKILVSGGNGTASNNEVNPVRKYLLARGVPSQDIFLDHASFDTYSSMYRARAIFGVASVLIVSQSFHLPRAVFIARQLGIIAYGVNADNGPSLFSNYIREVFADEKALFDLVIHRQPKYLGARISVTGDGRNSP